MELELPDPVLTSEDSEEFDSDDPLDTEEFDEEDDSVQEENDDQSDELLDSESVLQLKSESEVEGLFSSSVLVVLVSELYSGDDELLPEDELSVFFLFSSDVDSGQSLVLTVVCSSSSFLYLLVFFSDLNRWIKEVNSSIRLPFLFNLKK